MQYKTTREEVKPSSEPGTSALGESVTAPTTTVIPTVLPSSLLLTPLPQQAGLSGEQAGDGNTLILIIHTIHILHL